MDGYSPVQWVYREIIEEEIAKGTNGKIFHFGNDNEVCSTEGKAISMKEINGKGLFIELHDHTQIRVDRIITLFGKPGAAFDLYDSFGNVCFECTGGYPL